MIQRLDDVTIGQIAAGEIVERPLSVVKELVENALDAGAQSITVALERGGIDRIVVRDDGVGIAPRDLTLALQRHATSKLKDAAGLNAIATLGFRGEGLAAIAAVARTRVVSRTGDGELGAAVEGFGETIEEVGPVAAPPGTTVEVRELFANVPVRREYLRGPAAEFARISNFLAMMALAYPAVRFALAHDGREVWTLGAASGLDERLAHVFGPRAARELLFASDAAREDGIAVRGHVSRPGFDRPDRRMQLLFINGRLLRSTLLAGTWSAAYATYAMTQRQPFGVLFVDVAADAVDPNVHPTKSDVRLRHAVRVADRVRRAIVATLERDARARAGTVLSFAPNAAPLALGFGPAAAFQPDAPSDGQVHPGVDAGEAPVLRILAQLDDTYILATDGSALVLVDQHAAHERVAFEEIAARGASPGPSEPLLVPQLVELDAERWERLESVRTDLLAGGLEIEPFGERTYRIVATPAGYGARAFDLRAYVDDLDSEIRGLDQRGRVWATLACHSVVRAGDRLEPAEMSALLARLVRCANPMHCPHGRPTMIRIEADDIARSFKRV